MNLSFTYCMTIVRRMLMRYLIMTYGLRLFRQFWKGYDEFLKEQDFEKFREAFRLIYQSDKVDIIPYANAQYALEALKMRDIIPYPYFNILNIRGGAWEDLPFYLAVYSIVNSINTIVNRYLIPFLNLIYKGLPRQLVEPIKKIINKYLEKYLELRRKVRWILYLEEALKAGIIASPFFNMKNLFSENSPVASISSESYAEKFSKHLLKYGVDDEQCDGQATTLQELFTASEMSNANKQRHFSNWVNIFITNRGCISHDQGIWKCVLAAIAFLFFYDYELAILILAALKKQLGQDNRFFNYLLRNLARQYSVNVPDVLPGEEFCPYNPYPTDFIDFE